jgi:hypothetical protein
MMDRTRFPRPMTLTLAVPTVALALLAGCGDDGDSAAADEERAVTPREAIAEIGQVRDGLDAGLAAYRQGDAAEADELVGDAYLEHFELVEGPLGERDEELNEELEELIRDEIRSEIGAGAPAPDVAALVGEANRELGEAEEALRG